MFSFILSPIVVVTGNLITYWEAILMIFLSLWLALKRVMHTKSCHHPECQGIKFLNQPRRQKNFPSLHKMDPPFRAGVRCLCRQRREVSSSSWNGRIYYILMMTSSNGNIFRVTDPMCGEFIGQRWIPRTKASDAEVWDFLWSALEYMVE